MRTLFLFALALFSISLSAEGNSLIVATTSSLVDTGFLDSLIPSFEREKRISVKLVVTGSGQAFSLGRRGEADLLLVHSEGEEMEFVRKNFGILRTPFMYNYFVLLGPREDPCGALKCKGIREALRKIAASRCKFVSRGDNSGTHILEMRLWNEIGLPHPKGSWYEESGSGMGSTLNIALQRRAYTISDSGTYTVWRRILEKDMVSLRDPSLINLYSAIAVNPKISKSINFEGAKTFLEFLSSDSVKDLIRNFGVERYGEALFKPYLGKEMTTWTR